MKVTSTAPEGACGRQQVTVEAAEGKALTIAFDGERGSIVACRGPIQATCIQHLTCVELGAMLVPIDGEGVQLTFGTIKLHSTSNHMVSISERAT